MQTLFLKMFCVKWATTRRMVAGIFEVSAFWRFSASRLSAKPVLQWQTFYSPNSRRSWRKPFH